MNEVKGKETRELKSILGENEVVTVAFHGREGLSCSIPANVDFANGRCVYYPETPVAVERTTEDSTKKILYTGGIKGRSISNVPLGEIETALYNTAKIERLKTLFVARHPNSTTLPNPYPSSGKQEVYNARPVISISTEQSEEFKATPERAISEARTAL